MTSERYFASAGGAAREVLVEGPTARLADAGTAEVRRLPHGSRFFVSFGGRAAVGFAERRDGVWHIELEGRLHRVRVDDERTHRIRELTAETGRGAAEVELRAPMPGLVVRVAVAEGDTVEAGDTLVVMEAMKMENELRAEQGGVVAEVHASEGTTVDRDDLLVTFASNVEST
ncbi:MAG TPA: biotin/lipoyl-containing protein [Gemmatimonadota bacterium]|nr:biotin/lipoyl-containing protein [Gemmatimonadota bacterium]